MGMFFWGKDKKEVQSIYLEKERWKNKWLQENGRPKTVFATGKTKGGSALLGGGGTHNEQTLKNYLSYYKGEGTIFASINITAWNTVMTGYTLDSQNDEAREAVRNFLDEIYFDFKMLENTKYALMFGDSYVEKVYDGKSFVNIKTADPITMNINVDEFGREESYYQKIKGEDKPPLKPEEIVHFKFFPQPQEPYGISIIEPSLSTIDRKLEVDEALAQAIIRHGTGKFVITVGDKDDVPPADVFRDIRSKLEDITAQNEFIVPGPVSIKEIDQKGIPGVENYYNYYQTQLVIGMLCPEEALGLGRGSTEATSKVKQIMYERQIRDFQYMIAQKVKREIINPWLEQNGFEPNEVSLKFNSVTDADEAVKAKWLGNILRSGINPFTDDEIRAMFGYGPRDNKENADTNPIDDEKPEKPENIKKPEDTGEEEDNEEKPEKLRNELDRDKRLNRLELELEELLENLEEMRNINGNT